MSRQEGTDEDAAPRPSTDSESELRSSGPPSARPLDRLEPLARALAESSDSVLVTTLSDARVLDLNESARRALGYAREEIIGRCALDLAVWEDPDERQELGRQLRGEAPPGPREARFRHGEGGTTWVQFSVHVIELEGEPCALVVGRDVSDQRRLEQELRRSKGRLEDLLESVPAAFVAVDSRGVLTFANAEAERWLEMPRSELLGISVREDWPRTVGPEFCDALEVALVHGRSAEVESLTAAGNRWVEAHFWPTEEGVSIHFRDVTKRKRAEERSTRLFALSLDMFCTCGFDGYFKDLNPAWEQILAHPREELLSRPFIDFVHPDDRQRTLWEAERLAGEDPAPTSAFENRWRHADGSWRHLTWTARASPDEPIIFGVARDITERRGAEERLERTARQQAAVAALGERALEGAIPSAVMDEAVAIVRDTLEVDLGTLFELRAAGEPLLLRASADRPDGPRAPTTVLADRGSQDGYALRSEGPIVVGDPDLEERFAPSGDLLEQGVRSGMSVVVGGATRAFGVLSAHATEDRAFGEQDVTFLQGVANVLADAIERQRSDDALRHQALHDPLTGLPNRALFIDRLRHALQRSRREQTMVAVLFVDLDHFKVVNDSLGHTSGDELLTAVAPRLQECLRPGDTIARFGGDEFLVLCENVDSERAPIRVAERLEQCFVEPFVVAGTTHFTTASIGVSLATSHHEGPEGVIRDADAAMYRAKERGRARYEVFDEAMRARAVARLRTESALRGALERDELSLAYQPIVSMAGGGIDSFEVLLRWDHPELGMIPPDEAIPVAEESGLILPIGEWVLWEACREAVGWRGAGVGTPPPVCVNVSARQVLHPGFPGLVAEVLAGTGLHPARLRLEITETVLMEDTAPLASLRAIKRSGVSLVLDDFGRGYSSLSYLKRFPIDVLKIDRDFVKGLSEGGGDAAIVAAVVGMARALDIEVVAEGVETATQAACLESLGCDLAQGYLFSPPVPNNAVAGLLGAPAYGLAPIRR